MMTSNNKPLIFISNDDGVNAKGINELIRFLRPLGNLVIMAPTAPRSGHGCALTVGQPVSYHLVSEEPGLTIYACTGTPVDCMKLALETVLEKTPDIVVSGINHGDNSGVNVHYSGTMGVAIEACLKGIPAIGLSLDNHAPDADFQPLEKHIQQIISGVLRTKMPDRTCLNVNFPAGEIRGLKVCEQAVGRWTKEWQPVSGADGKTFLLTGDFVNTMPDNEMSDNWALANGYIAVTPVTVDMTNYSFLNALKQILF